MADLYEQVQKLEDRIEDLEKNKGELAYPPSDDSKSAIDFANNELFYYRVFDYFFNNLWYWSTFFEGVGGWDKNSSTDFTGSGVSLFPEGIVTGSVGYIEKCPAAGFTTENIFNFSKRSAFRMTYETSQVIDHTDYMVAGGVGTYGYGFKMTNGGEIYGVTHDGTSETTKKLGTITDDTMYQLSAYFIPKQAAMFAIDGSVVGTISETLPNVKDNNNLFRTETTLDADTDTVAVYLKFLEIIQYK